MMYIKSRLRLSIDEDGKTFSYDLWSMNLVRSARPVGILSPVLVAN